MEVVLEQDDVKKLLLEALRARGLNFPDEGVSLALRPNHKKGTFRVSLKHPLEMDVALDTRG